MTEHEESIIRDFPAFQLRNPVSSEDMESICQAIQTIRFLCTYGAWEQIQTHQSIIPYAIEEVYELQEAVLNEDKSEMISELGDILLQVIFHAMLAERVSEFSLKDIAQTLSQKIRQRSTPIFAGEILSIAEQDAYWQSQKTPRQASADQLFAAVKLAGSPWQRASRVMQYLDSLDFPLSSLPATLRYVDLYQDTEEIFQENLHNFIQELTQQVKEYGKIPQSMQEWYEILGLLSE